MFDIYIWNSRFLLTGDEFSEEFHSHYPVQIILSPGKPVRACLKNGSCVVSEFLMIRSSAEHRCFIEGRSLSLFIDPETGQGRRLTARFEQEEVVSLSGCLSRGAEEAASLFLKSAGALRREAEEIFETLLYSVIEKDEADRQIDPRIACVLERIAAVPDKMISLPELAGEVCLSESRLMHLFKENIGIPVRRYLLWKRMMDGILLIREGAELTFAALEAGFSDYAHFSRTFKRHFGTGPKTLKNSRFVHVFTGDSL